MLRYLDDEKPLTRYLEIKAELKRLDAELKELQPLILNALWEEPDNRAEYAGFERAIGTRRTFAYSEAVQELERTAKELKKEEEQNGEAVLTRHTSYVIVRAIKADQPNESASP